MKKKSREHLPLEEEMDSQVGSEKRWTALEKIEWQQESLQTGGQRFPQHSNDGVREARETAAQRMSESGLLRYKEVLLKEKKANGVEVAETELSKLSHKTSDFLQYMDYLKTKAKTDALTWEFYRQKKWRGWRFRIFGKRKSSEDKFGKDCVILLFYGN